MKDAFGRTIDYMRISITDRCNLRCRYCMPEGIQTVAREDILTLEEIHILAACAARLGVRHIKVTGGEPLVRRDCCELVRNLKQIPGIETVTITTNGILLESCLDQLVQAGIDGINISLDTLDRERYQKLTGGGSLEKVLSSIKQAVATGIPVKINAVSLELGDENWKKLLSIPQTLPADLRFIEMMPIGYGKNFPSMDNRQLQEKIRRLYPEMEPDLRRHGFGPAVYVRIPGFKGAIGFISAIHGKFCSSCNRIRLTSQGYLKTCLCYDTGTDLRAVLRQNWGSPQERDRQLERTMAEAIRKKPGAHCFEHPQDMTEEGNMISIGG